MLFDDVLKQAVSRHGDGVGWRCGK